MKTVAVILAAGLGTRMKSRLPKVLHPVLGDPSLLWVLRSLPDDIDHALVVVHHGKAEVAAAMFGWHEEGLLRVQPQPVDQGQPLGTGHAVQACAATLDRLGAERVLILSGDVPLTRPETLTELTAHDAALMAMDLERPGAYGRVLQHPDGRLAGLVEFKDATEAQRAVRRVNGGIYALPWAPLKAALAGLKNDNAQGEYYLTDAVAAVAAEVPVAVQVADPGELLGMNSRADQALLQAAARDRLNARWMAEGVTFLDPASALIGPRATLGADTVVEPMVRLEGACTVGEGCLLGQGSILVDAVVEAGARIRPYSVLEGAQVGAGAVVGPFARLREGTELAPGVHIGNFVETKKAKLGKGAKANHLAYLGDAEIGEGTNVGAGVITCNYDGFAKHRTVVGKGAFIGSDTQLVAPVSVGDGAIVAAGSTVTQDVPADALALSRTSQVNKEGGAARQREKRKPKLG
ncbi:MAG TPA: bifunctional UDP-N-acetylglucosamine diphosphorylase/glucosamine-1-phosphate N-acetyltransferase GlmU [Holophagaceae bacterium]|nr:bifunctional UDP-N-acetylglucosamine diphosphorylase/glucosamine-1-phosphate N-acetyltransferase GlmU [Holophagaceae bacterium]